MSAADPLATLLDLWRASTFAARRVDRPLGGAHGLSLVDLAILVALDGSPGGRLRRVELADRLGMSQSSVTRLLAPLERIGVVRRVRDERDRRAAFAELTDAGRRLTGDAVATARSAAEDVLRGWPDEEVAALDAAVTRLTAGAPGLRPVG